MDDKLHTLRALLVISLMGIFPDSLSAKVIKYESFDTAVPSAAYDGGAYPYNGAYPYQDSSAIYRIQTKTSYGFNTSTQYTRAGSRAARFEMRKADKDLADNHRSEGVGRAKETDKHRWYGLSMYLPTEAWSDSDAGWNIITQFWQPSPSGAHVNPPVDLYIQDGIIKMAVTTLSPDEQTKYVKRFIIGPVSLIRGKWADFTYHMKFSHLSDGILQLWIDGKLYVDYKGPNSYDNATPPYFKFGLYKRASQWLGTHTKRTVFVDEVRVGDGLSSRSEVSPLPLSNTPKISKFSLIDSLTGAEILPSALDPKKYIVDPAGKCLNIQAHTEPAVIGSVGFDLDSVLSFSIENKEPYFLMGDSGEKGCLELGSHTFSATPYSLSNLTGTAGDKLAHDFEIAMPYSASITKFSLIDVKYGKVIIESISPGQIINVSPNGRCLNVKATTNPLKVGSIGFGLNGNSNFSIENSSPYFLMGDKGEKGCLGANKYTVDAQAYSLSMKAGDAGARSSIIFTIAP